MRTNVFIKVVIEHDSDEKPERLANEICRQIQKVYGVILAEVSSMSPDVS